MLFILLTFAFILAKSDKTPSKLGLSSKLPPGKYDDEYSDDDEDSDCGGSLCPKTGPPPKKPKIFHRHDDDEI